MVDSFAAFVLQKNKKNEIYLMNTSLICVVEHIMTFFIERIIFMGEQLTNF